MVQGYTCSQALSSIHMSTCSCEHVHALHVTAQKEEKVPAYGISKAVFFVSDVLCLKIVNPLPPLSTLTLLCLYLCLLLWWNPRGFFFFTLGRQANVLLSSLVSPLFTFCFETVSLCCPCWLTL